MQKHVGLASTKKTTKQDGTHMTIHSQITRASTIRDLARGSTKVVSLLFNECILCLASLFFPRTKNEERSFYTQIIFTSPLHNLELYSKVRLNNRPSYQHQQRFDRGPVIHKTRVLRGSGNPQWREDFMVSEAGVIVSIVGYSSLHYLCKLAE